MIRIRKAPGINTINLLVFTVIGFAGGVYIWKPIFEKLRNETQLPTAASAAATDSTTDATAAAVPATSST